MDKNVLEHLRGWPMSGQPKQRLSASNGYFVTNRLQIEEIKQSSGREARYVVVVFSGFCDFHSYWLHFMSPLFK